MTKKYILKNLNCQNCANKIVKRISSDLKYSNVNYNIISNELTFEAESLDSDELIINKIQKIVNMYESDVIVLKENNDEIELHEEHHHENIGEYCSHNHNHKHHHKEECCNHDHHNHEHEEACCCHNHEHGHKHHHDHNHDSSCSCGHNHDHKENKKGINGLLIRIIFSLVLIVVNKVLKFEGVLEVAIYAISYLTVSYKVLLTGLKNIINKNFLDEFFLMSIASIAAFFIQEYVEAVMVIIFYLIGEYLQDKALDSSRNSIKDLLNNTTNKANLKQTDGTIIEVDVKKLKVNDVIVIKKGEYVPTDCVLLEAGIFDTKSLTGEGIYKEYGKEDEIYGGYINVSNAVEAKVSKVYADSTINKINKLLQTASNNKSKSEKFISVFSKYYTPIVIILAFLISLIGSITTGDYHKYIEVGVIFLVISCPCGLVLSIPLSYFAGIAKASQNGLLVKGGQFFDIYSKSNIFVFDKTGTITEEKLKIKEICNMSNMANEDFLNMICSIESFSSHPIAFSLLDLCDNEKLKINLVSKVNEISGMGISCKYDNHNVLIGNNRLLSKYNIEPNGNHLINVVVDNKFVGYINFENKLKDNVKEVLSDLNKELIMLTGDSVNNIENILKLNLFDDIKTDLLPDQKYYELSKIIDNNKKFKKTTIYVGDGINDSLCLKGSDCGISMGKVGSDIAIEASDIVIVDDNIHKLQILDKISKKVRKIVFQNIVFILTVKIVVMILSLFGYSNVYLGMFADVGVSLIAILNSIRILKMKL